jgi:protein-L-isoaspartate(D-aspartate) O-methyltransferase
MDRDTELEIIRRAYAKHVMAAAGVVDRRIEAAFAAVKREDFLGRGPWRVMRWGHGYVTTPTRNPVFLYDDVVVAVVPERNLNNGQPSFLAALISGAAPRAGEHAVHVGAGVGYYTAILTRLVGRTGRVTAIELDPVLAERLGANLAGQPNVRVIQGDGARVEFAPADVILVNAGATRPADAWLDALAEGGRLILPLTAGGFPNADVRHGAVFRITRQDDSFLAKRISGVAIFPCEGMRDAETEAALAAAFAKGRVGEVTRLYRRDDVPEEDCWVCGRGWCLAYA